MTPTRLFVVAPTPASCVPPTAAPPVANGVTRPGAAAPAVAGLLPGTAADVRSPVVTHHPSWARQQLPRNGAVAAQGRGTTARGSS